MKNADMPAGKIPGMTIEDQKKIMTEINNTKADFPKSKCLCHLFEEQAVRTPNSIAISDDNKQVTYAELNKKSNKLARYLHSSGAVEGSVIAVFMGRSTDLLVALLAVQKAGCSYIPLDPVYPKDRLALILEDGNPALILTEKSEFENLPETPTVNIFIEETDAYENLSGENTDYKVSSETVAYIIYTSGSTGKPKGVQIQHRALVNFILSMAKRPGITKDDIMLAVTTISFDIAGLELYLPIICGAKVVLAGHETQMNPDLLSQKITENQITILQATPVTFKILNASEWSGSKKMKILCGGEAMSKELAQELLGKCGELWNMYGPTETTIWSTIEKVGQDEIGSSGYVNIGKPIDNTFIYVLNEQLQPVPFGDPGELFIGGDGLAKGYYKLPEMTKEKFLADPFTDQPDARMYRTGDMVQLTDGGKLEYLNRVDFQVKIRGFRIELGEIESAIAKHDNIRDNVVIAREDIQGNKLLVAYIILKLPAEFDLGKLRKFLGSKLPEYMVPSAFVIMDQFPLTPNGKIDRKVLPAPDDTSSTVSSNYVAPVTKYEKETALIWSEVLKIEHIGITDNFIELGGNSLIAALLITRIKKVFNLRLSIGLIFKKQTIKEIAEEIESQIKSVILPDQAQTIPHLEGVSNVYPLSPGQKRLWFVENFEPGGRAYNMPYDYSINGELNELILEQSIDTLLKRHDALRTVIQTVDGVPIAKIIEHSPFKLAVENLEQLSEEEKKYFSEKHSTENELHVFDLEKGPLFIFKLLKLSTTKWILLFNMHHAVTDGWSVKIFVDELELIYKAISQQKPVNLPSLPITYMDFANWQNHWLEGEEYKKQLDFWIKELKGAPDFLQLPMDFHRPKNQTYDGDEVQFTILPETTNQLRQFSQNHDGSLFVTMLSVFNTLISRYALQEEFLIGIPISGRIYEEQESLIGMQINNFPLRITPLEQMTFPEMYEMCRKKFYAAFDNQILPIDRIIEELKVARTPNITPLFQVMFNQQDMFNEKISLLGNPMEMIEKRRKISQFDLTMNIYETGKSLNCVFEYNTNLFKRSRIERMAGHFTELVSSLMKNPVQKIRQIPLLTENEKKVILVDWNKTKVDFPENQCIHQLFESQVTKTPDKVAIRDEKRQMSYAELNQKANKLARHLHKSGAVEGSLIAICMERSADILVALLAVQKSGCTYIPLDPIYPKDRLALILEDANPVVMLTERKLLGSLPETTTKNIFIEEEDAYLNESGENTDFKVTPETIAYLIYTSGSTGKPKGVQIQQRALVNFIASMAKRPGITADDILLAVTTISFDIAGLEMYLPITSGASVFVASHETSMNPDLLIQRIEDTGATILQATPVTFRMLNSAEWSGSKRLKILCGGEAMPKELAYDLIRKCKELWNMYGPTETTVWSTVEKVVINDNDRTGYVNLGKPIDNTLIYVLNPEFQPVPVGYPGELFIGGDGLAKGYFKLPEMTKDKFLPDPFSKVPGARMYRTGDLVQQTEEGKLEFLNRVDSQVKIRGFRIELGEIESALTLWETVEDNVVIVREDTPGDKKLVAYIIKNDQKETDLAELRQFLKTKIPDYMVPTAFVFIDQFPLTPNGKIDRKALPSPQEVAPQEAKAFLEPRTGIEKKLAEIWTDVLKVPRIGIDENFFEIGGHSMLAVTLMVKIEKELGTRLPLSVLFDHSNIEAMAKLLDKKEDGVSWGSLVPIRPKGSKRPLYLVHGAGLNLLLYTTIVAHLDPDQPVFGLQAKGLDGVDEPLYTIEDIAAYYNSEIFAVDQSGSYALAGFSMGGQIAYEMARQLVEKGKKVSFLGVFDTVSENASDHHIPFLKRYYLRMDRLFHQVFWITGTFLKLPGNKKLEFAKAKYKSIRQKITKDDYKIKPEGVSKGKQSELPKYLHKVHQANYIAMEKYILPPYPGKLHLFRATDQKFYIKDPVFYGWDEFVKEVIILHIPGEHSTIFAPPNDKLFAHELQKCLDERDV